MNLDEVRHIALALPGAEEGTSYGTCSFRVKGKLFARLREDGESLVLKCNLFERQYLLDDFPDVFYLMDHYRDYPFVLARISAIDPELLRERMEASWRSVAPKKLIAELDRRQAG
jgi:hypothetical protein